MLNEMYNHTKLVLTLDLPSVNPNQHWECSFAVNYFKGNSRTFNFKSRHNTNLM